MTRQRKEIFKKIEELNKWIEAEIEMGCGFGADKINHIFTLNHESLMAELAATYGMTLEQCEVQYER